MTSTEETPDGWVIRHDPDQGHKPKHRYDIYVDGKCVGWQRAPASIVRLPRLPQGACTIRITEVMEGRRAAEGE